MKGAAGQSSPKIRLDLRERSPPTISLVDATVKMKRFAHPALGADSSASEPLRDTIFGWVSPRAIFLLRDEMSCFFGQRAAQDSQPKKNFEALTRRSPSCQNSYGILVKRALLKS